MGFEVGSGGSGKVGLGTGEYLGWANILYADALYNTPVGTAKTPYQQSYYSSLGLTEDSSKSGIVGEPDSQLKLCIKY